jgi:hypothetical protein
MQALTNASDPAYVANVAALHHELQRLRDEVVRARIRSGATIDKCQLLTLLAEAAARGELRVSLGAVADGLARLAKSSAPSINTVRKALIDVAETIDSWYDANPSVRARARILSNGTISLVTTERATSEGAFRELLKSLPGVTRRLLPWGEPPHAFRDRWRFMEPSSDESEHGRPDFRWLARIMDTSRMRLISDEDLALTRDLLYDMTSSSLAAVIHNLDTQDAIVAVEHHPTHNIDQWDDHLTWLNHAYDGYAARRGKIIRVVYFDPDDLRSKVASGDWWTRWCEHIEIRSRTDRIAVVTGNPDPSWCRALDADYLVLVNKLVIRYDRLDFPRSFEGLPAAAIAASRVNVAATHLVRAMDRETPSLTVLPEMSSIRARLDEIRERLLRPFALQAEA